MADPWNHDEPVLAHVEPILGGLFADQSYEAAMSAIAATVARISAALRGASAERADHLRHLQRDLIRRQIELMPIDDAAISAVYERCRQVRTELTCHGK
jgi:hypothetical protein